MKKYENFCAALKNLKEIFDYEEPYTNLTMTGLVAYYSISGGADRVAEADHENGLCRGNDSGGTGLAGCTGESEQRGPLL